MLGSSHSLRSDSLSCISLWWLGWQSWPESNLFDLISSSSETKPSWRGKTTSFEPAVPPVGGTDFVLLDCKFWHFRRYLTKIQRALTSFRKLLEAERHPSRGPGCARSLKSRSTQALLKRAFCDFKHVKRFPGKWREGQVSVCGFCPLSACFGEQLICTPCL